MRNNYIFAPIIILIILIATFLGSYVCAQTQVIKVKTQVNTESSDSIKVIVKTIELSDGSTAKSINIDSIILSLSQQYINSSQKNVKIIKIANGDTVISGFDNDSLANIWIEKFDENDTVEFGKDFNKHVIFINDSSVNFGQYFDYDTLLNSLNKIQFAKIRGEGILNIEKIIEVEETDGKICKEIKIIMHHSDSNMIFIDDDGENIRIEHKGEMVFINKQDYVKDVDSLLEVIEDKDGHKVIIIKTRIVLDELTENEQEGLKTKGLKTGKKELEFDFVKFYPNPAKEGININFKLTKKGTTEVIISNMVGQKVFEEKLKDFNGEYRRNISLKEYGTGTYILQIVQGQRVISRKIIIE